MAAIDIVIPTYKGIVDEARVPLDQMMLKSNCFCRDNMGVRRHNAWECNKGKHHVRLVPQVKNSSVVHWARNEAIACAMNGPLEKGRPRADYYFLMDDDMVAEPGYLLRLASYKLDIVCGICTIRRDPPIPNIRFWNEEQCAFVNPVEWDWDAQKLIEIDAAGAAFMLVKSTVLEKMGEAFLNCHFEMLEDLRKTESAKTEIIDYWTKQSARRKERYQNAIDDDYWQGTNRSWFQFLDNVRDDQTGEMGEDISFCWKAKKLGFKIYADPQVLPGHLGTYAYSIRDYREHVEQSQAAGRVPEKLTENRVSLEV